MLNSERFIHANKPEAQAKEKVPPSLALQACVGERFAMHGRPIGKPGRHSPALRDLGIVAILFRWAVLAMLAAHLLFAHGCHGGEDHELLAGIQRAAGF
jgi:hypothetical protein